jgi:hypothetical protein
MLKKYWGIEPDADLVATKNDLRDIIKLLRFKLITQTKCGTADDEYVMKTNFRNNVFLGGVFLGLTAALHDDSGLGPAAD